VLTIECLDLDKLENNNTCSKRKQNINLFTIRCSY